MATPSSGQICWSDIQAATGGGYCMLDFNSATGRGYCAGDYYNYSPSHDVYINFYYPNYVGCYNYYYFAATSNETLSTSLTITMYWYGDLGGAFNGSVTINSGASCGSNSWVYSGGVYCGGEYYSSNNYYFSPNSYGSQNYVGNQVYLDLYPC
jgi:hypothetical protein